ncbi:MAG: VOC family protein [Candidatus Gracilibacteria bacterium]|nr:VOC family protein [Candidatus Gracilibacteria bacterium]
MERNVVGWFEIPVTDMERAIPFYQSVFDVQLERHQMDPIDMAWFPMLDEKTGSPGSLVCQKDSYKPSHDGALLYFTAQSGDLKNEVGRVEAAGGKILSPPKLITEEYGYMALVEDTEGNRIAIHSQKHSA